MIMSIRPRFVLTQGTLTGAGGPQPDRKVQEPGSHMLGRDLPKFVALQRFAVRNSGVKSASQGTFVLVDYACLPSFVRV